MVVFKIRTHMYDCNHKMFKHNSDVWVGCNLIGIV